ncbi:hypothetical protein N8E89_17780 [Phyllobacterium sp. A18/5-2]|uniref:hypothetical protein n=1 Tax=Phyllobacterium sp. A18/5-2 TaxID=2978392 RepID=UPI0021C82B50|nr:hypothetical protein [Phyllobacterium sp. A18/5-2]UXN64232.1 hypothetical protein N8E89_17780 [Phyllobacterium sp. A18/5-2]
MHGKQLEPRAGHHAKKGVILAVQRDINVKQGMSAMIELVTPPKTHSFRRDWL